MTDLIYMHPSFASPNKGYERPRNSIFFSELVACKFTFKLPYFNCLLVGKFCRRGLLANWRRAVNMHIGVIFGARRPSQMLRIHASKVPIAARVRSFMGFGWRSAVSNLAHKFCGAAHMAFMRYYAITSIAACKWPRNAIFSAIIAVLINPFKWAAYRCSSANRIAVASISCIMCLTKSKGIRLPATPFNIAEIWLRFWCLPAHRMRISISSKSGIMLCAKPFSYEPIVASVNFAAFHNFTTQVCCGVILADIAEMV